MRILITGVISLMILCFVSAWLYNDKLLPVIKKTIPIVSVSEAEIHESDSLMKLNASIPNALMIYFEFNKAKFNPDQETPNSILPFKTWLDKYPGSMLSVTGHTDLVGSVDYNYNLGLERAQVIGNYLETQGVNVSRMVISSRGETEPAADYLTKDGRAKNRRTEISIKMQ